MQNPAKVRGIFSSIAERYDLANHLLSGGLDFLWRARAVRMVKKWHPHSVLDLATGSGDLALAMQKAMPHVHIIGADFCLPMLQIAARKNLSPLVVADGTALPFADASFDAVAVAFGLRNMESWPGALREISRVLRPGGHLRVRQPLEG
jgi:demethylmenaquinone methyltransferase/2-methoxy-6-polyprenyl-1,4-benzoquinol methylase